VPIRQAICRLPDFIPHCDLGIVLPEKRSYEIMRLGIRNRAILTTTNERFLYTFVLILLAVVCTDPDERPEEIRKMHRRNTTGRTQ
jgi:hypothetical protein